jgi:tRNA pseudouridine55 synthase
MIVHINKPKGITSHDVVNRIRKITGEQRVGHAGTLDPFATGVLVLAIGREDTKKLGHINEDSKKEYIAVAEFGKTSNTGDPTGIIRKADGVKNISKKHLENVLQACIGTITQETPIYSAVKIRGTRAYELARQGESPQMPKRSVTIYEAELLAYTPPFANIRIVCSVGTYIRTFIEDISHTLGTGAYTAQLTRTRVGLYTIQDSVTLEQLTNML